MPPSQSVQQLIPQPVQQPNFEAKIPQQTILGVGELTVSAVAGQIIKTFALGSCVAVNLFSPNCEIVGMAHVALASSQTSPEKAKILPGYFADTAISELIQQMRQAGYRKSLSQITAKLAGGALTQADSGNYFKIGEKNINAITMLLQQLSITIKAQDIGSSLSRTVFIQVGSDIVNISSPDRKSWVI